MFTNFRIKQADFQDQSKIWNLLQKAILKRKLEGSNQWQDGYPNPEVVKHDIEQQNGYVILNTLGQIVGYFALSFSPEPAYEELKTGWLTQNQTYAVVHRLALTQEPKIPGFATWVFNAIESLIKSKNITSVKVDTNFDNAPMLHLFNKMGYTYAGEVYFRGSARKAFEKIL